MSGRLADISAHIAGIRQLGSVVNAMRGIAAARAQQAEGQLAAVDAYTAVIAAAIARTLAGQDLPTSAGGRPSARPALVLFLAEQGFAGAYSERVLAAAAEAASVRLFAIGSRGWAIAGERGLAPAWTAAMPSHPSGVAKLADGIANALYAGIAHGDIDGVEVVYSRRTDGVARRVERLRLFPLDLSAFAPAGRDAPLHNLPPAALIAELTADYVHAQLCKVALHAYAAENEARMEAMASARTQIETQLGALTARQRIVRQEEITAEIIELAAGEEANREAGGRH